MPTISVCIPTHERPLLLRRALEALAKQSRLPDEIVISDSSKSEETKRLIGEFGDNHPQFPVRWVRSDRKALPWQRWWAFTHSAGEIVLFIDDDIELRTAALERLLGAYTDGGPNTAGVGLAWIVEGKGQPARDHATLRERWLGITGAASGSISPGGITISLPEESANGPCASVEWLSGGAMSFRREVLQRVGPLDNLYALYDAGVGKGEDGILSRQAARFGRLAYVTTPLAIHPPLETAVRTANANDGYRKGLLETWGRAHTMRWMSREPAAYRISWLRVAFLEVARSGAAILKSPVKAERWARLGGGLAGAVRTIAKWRQIPAHPSTQSEARA
jgi:glycosyltransferase involved in cell wall biosynthesis